MFRDKRLQTLKQRLRDYVKSRHERIEVIPAQGLFNFRCYWNSVEYASNNKGYSVVEVIYFEGGEPILHYINKNNKTGKYYETTLGYLAANFEYYFIRVVPEDEYNRMLQVFTDNLDSWLHQFSSWFDRKILGIDRLT